MRSAGVGRALRAAAACSLTVALLPIPGLAQPTTDPCLVVCIADGDTLTARCGTPGHYQQTRVRLVGIDAPEKRQPYGERTRQSLADLASRRWARLECPETDRYGRSICTV
jgi:endonuclease YncB( thermonuclease family)